MFDIGWGELFLIGIVALIVVGPKDLPALFRTLGNLTGKARVMARDFQRTLEQAADESGMSEVSKNLRSLDQSINSASDSARRFASQSFGNPLAGGGTSAAATDGPVDAVPPPHVVARQAATASPEVGAAETGAAETGAHKPKVVAKAVAVPVAEAAPAAPAAAPAPAAGEGPAS